MAIICMMTIMMVVAAVVATTVVVVTFLLHCLFGSFPSCVDFIFALLLHKHARMLDISVVYVFYFTFFLSSAAGEQVSTTRTHTNQKENKCAMFASVLQ